MIRLSARALRVVKRASARAILEQIMCDKSLARACAGGLVSLAASPECATPIAFANGTTIMAEYSAQLFPKASTVLQ